MDEQVQHEEQHSLSIEEMAGSINNPTQCVQTLQQAVQTLQHSRAGEPTKKTLKPAAATIHHSPYSPNDRKSEGERNIHF